MTSPSSNAGLDKKALSTMDLLIAGMSYMAPGFSLFFTTALIAAAAGVQIPLVYALAGLGVLCTGAALAEFSKIAPSAGSLQVFLQRGFGPTVSTAGGLILIVGYVCLQAGVAALFGGWTSELIHNLTGITVPWPLLTVIGVVVCTWMMVRGVALSIKATLVLFLIEFALVLAISLAVIVFGGAAGLSTEPLNASSLLNMPITAIANGMVLAAFSFVGFEGAISFAEETPDPARAMPTAVLGGVIGIALLYILAMYAVVVGFGLDKMAVVAGDPEPINTLASMYAHPLKPFLEFAIWTSIVANLMAAGNANARILFNMGREGTLPTVLGTVHKTNKTPYIAVIAFMAATLIPALGGKLAGWDYLATYGNVIGFGALLVVLIYMAATIALTAYVRRGAAGVKPRLFAHGIVPIVGAAVWLIPLWGALQPGQSFPFNIYPWIALLLIVVSILVAVARRSQAKLA